MALCDVKELLVNSPSDTLIAISIGERTSVHPDRICLVEGQKIGKVELRKSITADSEPTLPFCSASQKGGKVFRVILSNINEITEN